MKKDNKNTKVKQNLYPEVLETLKKNIRNIRKEKGFRSAESFAEELDVSLKTVQGWENMDNGRWPDLAMMIHLCEKTGCDLDYLLDRIKEPTHGVKYICDQTGLSVEAVKKLTSLKGTGLDDLLSEIITHKNAPRLLRVIQLAADEDEIAWLNLDELPRGLLSSYADKPIDFTAGIGSDVADFLASQEFTNVIKDIRAKREKERTGEFKENFKRQYNVYAAKMARDMMLEELEEAFADLYPSINWNDEDLPGKEMERRKRLLNKAQNLMTKIRNASFAEWNRGEIEKEYKQLMEGGKDNG